MRAMTRGVVALAVATLTRVPAQGQIAAAAIDSGTLVRMRLSNREIVRGRLLRPFAEADTLVTFCEYPTTPCASLAAPHVRTLRAARVTGVDVARGSHWIRGGLIGAFAGALLGGLEVSLANGLCDDTRCVTDAHHTALGLVAFGAALGALFGSQSVGWQRAR